jgi:uncharacterized protein YecE (DUF72 family)
MEFGKVDILELEDVDYSLPPDPASTLEYLRQKKGQFQTRIHVGCSKWGQKEWVGEVYPQGTAEKDFLHLYIENYDCIELDTTFYNIQRKNVLRLVDAVKGKDFKVCPKFSRRISHAKNFEEAKDITEYYAELMDQFGGNLGSCILQLPEYFVQKRMDDLRYLLDLLPEGFPVNVELRNKGWFYEQDHPIFELLREKQAGTAIAATAGRRDVIHMQITSPVVIVRFVGNNLHPTDFLRMDLWAARINDWLQYQALKEIYFFVHHDDEAYSPTTVSYMAEKLKNICGVQVKAPIVEWKA